MVYMLDQNPSSPQFHSLKPIKEIRLRMFKQIYQKQKSKSNIYERQKSTQPRKSFLNVTRRYSVIDYSQYASLNLIQTQKNAHLSQQPSKNVSVSTVQENKNHKKGKQNIIINRIPIKIRSKRVNSKKQLIYRQGNNYQQKQTKSFCTKKLLQSPFHDDFICLERQSIIEDIHQEF